MTGRARLIDLMYNLICGAFLVVMRTQAQVADTPETSILITAPLNPVQEGDMLSIMCKITNLESGDSVLIQRTVDGETEQISYAQTVLGSVDNRFFLANRRLASGAVVYFLSVIDVTRERDEGEYECKVVQQNDNIIRRSTIARVQYFPSEPSPQCASGVPAEVTSGQRISFNCTSEDGLPEVDITWAVTGSTGDELPSRQERRNGMVYSHLTMTASMKYNEAVFICKISSSGFLTERTCHIGPLIVKPDPLNPNEPDYKPDDNDRSKPEGSDVVDISDPLNPGVVRRPDTDDVTECSAICEAQSNSTFYWIVATVITGVLAVIFLFIGICIAVKLCNMPQSSQHREPQHIGKIMYRQPLEDVYERIECGSRDEDRMYMALHGLRKPDNLVVQTNIPPEIEDNYTRTPTAPIQVVKPGVLPDAGGVYTRTSNAFTSGIEGSYSRTPTAITSDVVEVAGQQGQ